MSRSVSAAPVLPVSAFVPHPWRREASVIARMCDPDRDGDAGRKTCRRLALCAASLAIAWCAFQYAMVAPALTAVSGQRAGESGGMPVAFRIDGWMWTMELAPLWGCGLFLHFAFVLWWAAVELNSRSARRVGVGAAVVAAVLGVVLAVTFDASSLSPGLEPAADNRVVLRSGFWAWMAACVLNAVAFAALPPPRTGHSDDEYVVAANPRPRERLSMMFAVAASLLIVLPRAVLSTSEGQMLARSVAWGNEGDGLSADTEVIVFTPVLDLGSSLFATGWTTLPRAAALSAAAALPLALCAASCSRAARREAWRWTGLALAGGLVVDAIAAGPTPWPRLSFELSQLDLLWRVPPLIAFAGLIVLPRWPGPSPDGTDSDSVER